MLTVDVRVNVKTFIAGYERVVGKDYPFALARALTWCAKDAQTAIRKESEAVFDRPTKFTLNATLVIPAKKAQLFADVRVKDEALKNAVVSEASRGNQPLGWLYPQVEGGARLAKGSERLLRRAGIIDQSTYVVPGAGAKLDQFGNISRGEMQRILAVTQSARDPLQRTTTRSKGRNRAVRQYFLVRAGTEGSLKPGIYRREGPIARPVLIFVKQPRYRKRLKFYEVAEQTYIRQFRPRFLESVQQALSGTRS